MPDPHRRPPPPPDHDAGREEARRLERRADREKAARNEAERLLETKSLELYEANKRLSELNSDLEKRVELRTRELARAAAVRGEFLAAMSHEIRTPMTGVLGMMDLLRAEDLTPRQKGYVDSVHASGRHLLVIINDILDFSRMETGKIELEHETFSLPAILGRVESMLGPLAMENGLEFRVAFTGPAPPQVSGDATRLIQILLNLVGNAIKFTLNGSVVVTGSFERIDGRLRVRFEIRDTGIGIPAENQARLFNAFTQADRSTTRKYGGSGLGLAISKRLVDAMDGTIGARANPGGGSVFWFEILLEEGGAEQPSDNGPVITAPVVPRRILVAEDIALNRDVIEAMLTRDGHQLTFVENGQEALDLVQQSPFDIVLMDVQMPLLDGVEATRLIRQLAPPAGDVPIIALTANVMASEQLKCLQAGMNSVLMKPIDWEAMNRVIAQVGQAPRTICGNQLADIVPPTRP